MVDLETAEKIICEFFKQCFGMDSPEILHDETSVSVNGEGVKLRGKKAYSYFVSYSCFGTLFVQIMFEANLFDPTADLFWDINIFNEDSAFWKATVPHGDLCLRCYVYAVESEDIFIETLMASLMELKKNDSGRHLKELFAYIN